MDKIIRRADSARGQVLAGVVILLALMLIIVPTLVLWVQRDTLHSVKNRQSTTAFNLAEAAVDRGVWKLASSTYTWSEAAAGHTISGYNFDVTYADVPGGTYRIKFSAAAGGQVQLWGEGRDALRKETRSIQVVFKNTSAPGALMTQGTLTESDMAIVHWGPMLAQNNINIIGNALNRHYPRKLSKQVVLPYDSNGLTPPNTDNLEWWSGFAVPDLPNLDFATLRSSAVATNTINCNGNWNATNNQIHCDSNLSSCLNCVVNFMGNTVTNSHHNLVYTDDASVSDNRSNSNYVWYWDNNVNVLNPQVKGTIIVRGNLSTNGSDWYGPSGYINNNVNVPVPVNAWLEYQKIKVNANATATNKFPADNGNQKVTANYVIGAAGDTVECGGSPCSGNDLGFFGFIYVGKDVNFQGDADIFGAVWVVGNWSAAGNNLIFYDDNLLLPMLNVVLVRQSWQEVPRSTQAWN
ncbi:MAG: hypothetical protein NTY77_17940 [Elusimicrobia bacterium]|nr:hypothetical protein [Elusimicrobiota bacterium]